MAPSGPAWGWDVTRWAGVMRIAGIQGVRRGVHRTTTTTGEPGAPRHPDLVKRGWKTPNRPDAIWVADFTYLWTACGFAYVSFITDVYSRRILGWKASMSKSTDLVTAALAQALATRRRANAQFTAEGLIHHSVAGSQYTALAFTEELREAGIAGSIGTVGDALDNALMEPGDRSVQDRDPSVSLERTELERTARGRTRGCEVGPLVQHRKNSLFHRQHAPHRTGSHV